MRAQLEKGVGDGHPLVDVRVTLVDGKAHSVDSSDAAFQSAGALALRDAASRTAIRLLEPVAEVAVLLPDEYQGPVFSDLSVRRARVLGTERPARPEPAAGRGARAGADPVRGRSAGADPWHRLVHPEPPALRADAAALAAKLAKADD